MNARTPRTEADFAVMKKLGENIRKLRKHRGLTVVELGEKIGRSSNVIACYERGEYFPPPAMLAKLVVVLHTTWGTLFYGAEDAK